MEFAILCALLSLAFETALGIYGGELAEEGEFPHQVQIYYEYEFHCSGSILSPSLVITAAHCVHDHEIGSFRVVAGTNKLKHNLHLPSTIFKEHFQQIVSIRDYYVHSGFNKSGGIENDVAILLLSRPLEFSKRVRSISLPEKNETLRSFKKYSPHGVVMGWGQIGVKEKSSTRLKKQSLYLSDDERCKIFYFKRHSMNWYVRQNEICVRTFFGERVCPGDSGGALLCQKWDSKLNTPTSVLFGISSYSGQDTDVDCGDAHFQVFMNVADFRGWIDETISNITSRIFCNRGHFYCASNHTCLPRAYLCNKKADCAGGEDEMDCKNYESCEKEQFRCNNGKCIGNVETCDGTFDCEDMPGTRSSSDEEKCSKLESCGDGEHDCGEEDRCVSITNVCNGIVDCENGNDEENCHVEPKSSSKTLSNE